ncbi:MAG: hypothetical protein FJX76_05400 [Armatimonadetes bacterium]|nr:hypothetical protein [Armatimonadota bacterium]
MSDEKDDWTTPLPAHIPGPTYAPAILSLGMVMFAAGPVTSWFVSAVGLVVVGVGIWAWLGEIRCDRRSAHD